MVFWTTAKILTLTGLQNHFHLNYFSVILEVA